MTSPLKILDDALDPIITNANRIRQVRDALPPAAWLLVPEAFRIPLQGLFDGCEQYDRMIGRMKLAGLAPPDVGTKAPD